MLHKLTIISGGQTGVDRAALDVAINLNIPHRGWCPKGRLAEDGTISAKYNLQETHTSEYSERTIKNITDSDGTLIFLPADTSKITDGTNLTKDQVIAQNKPHLIINLADSPDFKAIAGWMSKNKIERLNIAGPRETQSSGIYKTTCRWLENFFVYLKNSDMNDTANLLRAKL